MQVCVQDPANNKTYLMSRTDLSAFAADSRDDGRDVDVLLIHGGECIVQELPSSRLSDSPTPTVQIVDSESGQSWIVDFESLTSFSVPAPPSDGDNIIWFAMPSAKEVLAAVPVVRRALVQHSS